MRKSVIISGVLAGVMLAGAAQARDYISISGSSTVLPFATIVAERLGRNPDFKTPVVESGGSSVGKKSVCDGVGTEFTDIGNASSRMKEKELAYCGKNGVKLTEIKVGYDGIVVAGSKAGELLKISKADLGKALTAMVPAQEVRDNNLDEMVPNPFTKWSEINPDLPDIAIRVYGPPTTSGTRASYAEMVNEKGYCKKDAEAKRVLAVLGLSGGQQQRLCIARAIAVSPEVILMDEPCSALDPIATAKVEELINELSAEYSIVIVTHSMQQAARISQRTAYFHLGKLIEVGQTKDVFTNPLSHQTEAYISGKIG